MKDPIERQAAIDAFYEMASDIDHLCTVGDYVHVLEMLPPAWPERCSDCIAHGGDWECDHTHCQKGRLPSAQPGIIRCKDCKYQDEGYRRISVKWLPCMDIRPGSNWYCGSAERRTDE